MSARYGRKLDSNHGLITTALKLLGAHVETIQGQTAGTPDLLIKAYGVERTAEVKPLGEKLNPNQVTWWRAWGGEPVILRTPQDCEALLAQMRGQLTRNEVAP